MKILIYSHRIGSKTITFIHNEINALAQEHDVFVVYHHKEEVLPLHHCHTIPIRHYHSRPMTRLLSRLNSWIGWTGLRLPSFSVRWDHIIQDIDPDVIHIHFGTIAERVLLCSRGWNRPIFISFHGYDASRSLKDVRYVNRLKQLFARKDIHPIFVSQFMKRKVEKALDGMELANHHILYYGTDLSFFRRTKRMDRQRLTYLQVSSFAEKKGHRYTVEAFRRYFEKYPDHGPLRIVLAGGGDLLEEIRDLVDEYKMTEFFEFPGWIDKEQARRWMEEAHYFIHHSIVDHRGDMEGIPNALMEAMAMELPVLSTRHSGIPELVEDGVNGYLVAEKDIEAYADRIHDIQDFGYMPENRQKVEEMFEMERHRVNLENFYQLKCEL